MKIVLASSEVSPFAKTGGLADVSGALPGELEKLGHEVTVIMPAYRAVHEAARSRSQTIEPTSVACEIPVGRDLQHCRFSQSTLPNGTTRILFVDHAAYFDREDLYNDADGDFPDNCERFVFFCRAVLEAVRLFDLQPDVIHANDWQTGLIPALLACEYRENRSYPGIASLLTIHNLAYQGLFDQKHMASTGLDPVLFNWQQMEYFGQLNLLKTGIVFADSINTVSQTYAEEIQTPEQGCGLEEVLKHRSDRLSGILNGIDSTEWNPATDPHIVTQFDSDFDTEIGSPGKAKCKNALQKSARLRTDPDVPLIGIVGRLASQKGWSLIIPVLRRWLEHEDAQWVILGTGDPDYHHVLTSLLQSHADKLDIHLTFSNELAHQIEAGSDMFLMPSLYEPCGLNQMYSMAYGTVPIVRQTGGLADTVINATAQTIADQMATGFSFVNFDAESLDQTIQRAVDCYRNQRPQWNQIMQNGMQRDWSWSTSAKSYEALYRQTIEYHRNEVGDANSMAKSDESADHN
ncbi:MAG: glycogen synthase GlgA [Planctomycetota bacterium]